MDPLSTAVDTERLNAAKRKRQLQRLKAKQQTPLAAQTGETLEGKMAQEYSALYAFAEKTAAGGDPAAAFSAAGSTYKPQKAPTMPNMPNMPTMPTIGLNQSTKPTPFKMNRAQMPTQQPSFGSNVPFGNQTGQPFRAPVYNASNPDGQLLRAFEAHQAQNQPGALLAQYEAQPPQLPKTPSNAVPSVPTGAAPPPTPTQPQIGGQFAQSPQRTPSTAQPNLSTHVPGVEDRPNIYGQFTSSPARTPSTAQPNVSTHVPGVEQRPNIYGQFAKSPPRTPSTATPNVSTQAETPRPLPGPTLAESLPAGDELMRRVPQRPDPAETAHQERVQSFATLGQPQDPMEMQDMTTPLGEPEEFTPENPLAVIERANQPQIVSMSEGPPLQYDTKTREGMSAWLQERAGMTPDDPRFQREMARFGPAPEQTAQAKGTTEPAPEPTPAPEETPAPAQAAAPPSTPQQPDPLAGLSQQQKLKYRSQLRSLEATLADMRSRGAPARHIANQQNRIDRHKTYPTGNVPRTGSSYGVSNALTQNLTPAQRQQIVGNSRVAAGMSRRPKRLL